ncbi:PEP-CTERM sorting domain-containing protein [Laspinema olomoucense]|uniref:PEP-CTERM sorting domain-containing protein n=1 Tax=Laspinema olomoucense TaxID=3231600 RepID=UPI0021BAFECB|nr:PEP-CTERM sorting domain-containing protein [Laspinema sp. D3a]MCT7986972.1 PEP-CTERM sorting domain-containing protein [Laspinema sp. D3a]
MITNLTFTNRLSKTALISLGLAAASLAFAPGQAKADSITFDASPKTGDPAKVNVTLDDTSNPGSITVTVNVVPEANTGNIGDINGVYFNLPDGVGPVTVGGVSGGPVNLGSSDLNGNAGNLGDGVNMQGGGGDTSFDVGIRIGFSGGASYQGTPDDFRTTTFTVSAAGLSLNSFTSQSFGIRLKSVGPEGGTRDGSSKVAQTITAPIVVATPPATPPGGDNPTPPVGDNPTPPGGDNPTPPVGDNPTPPGGGSDPVAVPEPMTIGGLLMGAGGLLAARRRKMSQKG